MSARARRAFGVIAILLGVLISATVPAAAVGIFSPGCSAVNLALVNLTPLQPSTAEFIGQFYAGDAIHVRGSLAPFTYTVQQDSGPPIVVSDESLVHFTVQGLGLISVANDSNAANILSFECFPSNQIVVKGVLPSAGSAGTVVTISGLLLDRVTAVHFGSAAATSFTINDPNTITATAPPGFGIVDVTVSDQISTSATSLNDQFSYPTATAPAVTAIAPASGPAAGGTSVTITGTGFGAATAVNFGSTAAAFTVINTTTITATSPPGTGIVDVTVVNSTGTSPTGAADRFSFAAPLVAGPKSVAAAYNSNGSTSTAIDLSSVITGGPATGVTVTVAPGHGGTSVNGTTLTYTPTTGYYGSDSFSYTANGPGGTSNAAVVSITVAAPVITVTPTSLAAGKIAVAYSQALTASGGNGPYTFSAVASGALPPGLSLSSAGVISGTPTATGVFSFTVSGSDSSSTPAAFTSASISIAINLPTLGLTPASGTPLTAVAETAYSRSFMANGGTAPYSFAALVINSGTLPAGLSFSTSTGILSGTATAAGSVSFTVSVTDSSTGAGPFVISGTYTLVVAAPAVTVSPSVLAVPTVGVSYIQTLTANGGSPAYAYAPTAGSLPAGLTLSASGVISGTPTTAGNYSFSVTATDTHGFAGSQTYSGAVNAPAATTTALISSLNPSRLQDSVMFTATVTSTGGVPTGTVTFHDGASILGTSALTAGVATLITTSLSVGTHAITASFGGGGGFASSASAALTQIVAIPADSVKLRQLQLAVTPVVAQASGHAITSSIDAAISDGFSDGGAFVTPSGGGLRFNFSADPDQSGPSGGERAASDRWNRTFGVTNSAGENTANHAATGGNPGRIDDAFAAIDRPTTATKAPSIMQQPKQWLLWADVGESGINRWGTALGASQSALYGSQVNALVGLTSRITPSFLLGIIGGYETFDYTSQDIGGKLKGQGWTLGSYVGWMLAPSIRFDAAVAYSGIGYDGIAGTAQGNFAGGRWLASGGLTGIYKALGFDIEPSVKVYALWERENAYTDSLGTRQDNRDFSTGRSSGGVRLSYPIAWSETIALMPYVGLYGDYYFTRDDAASIVVAGLVPLASIPLLEGWSARATGGLAAKFAGGTSVAVGGEFGGIGSNFQIWTYRVRARVPF
jgi:Autotransporter beta-domain/Bacterial Ig-like domain (group 3)/Putative Ig domain/IPT/TIG domain